MAISSLSPVRIAMQVSEPAQRSEWAQTWRRFCANRVAVLGLIVVVLLVLVALFAELLSPYDPTYQLRVMRGTAPSITHWRGTYYSGRDLFSRVLYGARIALLVGIGATILQV